MLLQPTCCSCAAWVYSRCAMRNERYVLRKCRIRTARHPAGLGPMSRLVLLWILFNALYPT